MKQTVQIELPDDEHCMDEDIVCPFVDTWDSNCNYFNEHLYKKNDKTLKCKGCVKTFRTDMELQPNGNPIVSIR